MAFRRSELDFTPSRGRTSFDLDADGAVRMEGPGPDDRSIHREGTWTLDGNLLSLHLPGQREQRFEVHSVDRERLLVRRAE